jgi:hypothetical protein
MALVAFPPLPCRQRVAVRTLLLALLLGLLSFTAVAQMRVKCEPVYLMDDDGVTVLTADDGVTVLTADGERQCHLVAGAFRVPLPSWLSPLFP